MKRAASWQNQQSGMCVQRRLRSESSLCAQWVAKDPSFLHADSEDSDQTGWMPRLTWVFAGRTCHFVGFVMRRLKEPIHSNTTSCPGHQTGKEHRHQGRHQVCHITRKCVFGDFWPGKIQTSLLSYRSQLESSKFGYSKYKYLTI